MVYIFKTKEKKIKVVESHELDDYLSEKKTSVTLIGAIYTPDMVRELIRVLGSDDLSFEQRVNHAYLSITGWFPKDECNPFSDIEIIRE